MPGNIYVPRERNPWETMMPNLLTQLALMKVAQNFQQQQTEIETERRLAETGLTKEAPEGMGGIKTEGIKEPEGGPTPISEVQKFAIGGRTYYQQPLRVTPIQGARGYFEVGRGTQSQIIKPTTQYQPMGTIGDYLLQRDTSSGEIKAVKIGEKETPSPYKDFRAGFLRRNPNADEGDIQAAFDKQQEEKMMRIAGSRGASFAYSRSVNVLDTENDNAPLIMSLGDVLDVNKKSPGRFMPAGEGGKALTRTALLEDIKGAVNNTRRSLGKLPGDFTTTQMAQLAFVLKSRDVRSAMSAFLGGEVARTLSPEQIDYVTDLAQLVENMYALRPVLGAGQGSDELRAAIALTAPSSRTPTKEYATIQLDKIEQQINRLGRGVPKVKLGAPAGPIESAEKPAEIATVVETRRTPDGRVIEKLSDGTIRLQGM